MADVTPKVKLFVFLSIIVMLFNLSTVCILAISEYNTSFNLGEYESYEPHKRLGNISFSDYQGMTNANREGYIYSVHGEYTETSEGIFYPKTGLKIPSLLYFLYVEGRIDSQENLNKFFEVVNKNWGTLPYSDDSNYASLIGGIVPTSFLPFTSILITATQFDSIYPFNIIVSIIILLISAIQLYYLIAIVFNHLPFFNV